jgi:hypothetical protein
MVIPKSESVMVRLKEIAEKDFPSALTSYIRNDSVLFPEILRISEVESRGKYSLEYFGNHYSRNSKSFVRAIYW